MRRRLFISASLLAAAAAGAVRPWRSPTGRERSSPVERAADGRFVVRAAALAFDTSISVYALHPNPSLARRAAARALRAVAELDAGLVVQRPGSQVGRLNAEGRLERPDRHLLHLLEFAQALGAASNGAFDPTVQPLWDLHIESQRRGCQPGPRELAEVRSRVNWSAIDVSRRRVRLPPRMSITLNGLVQGYAADVAFDTLAQEGVLDALIDAGEYGALGRNPTGRPWRVGIQHPRDPGALIGSVPMDGRFLATSGDYATRFTDDFRLNHIFDPHTGVSPLRFSSVAVAASTGLLADGLTKPMMVLDLASAQRLLDRYPGAGAVWIDKASRIVATRNLDVERV